MRHLDELKMNYFQHMLFALKNAATLFRAFITLVVHAALPDCFVNASSALINKVHYNLMANRHAKSRILVRFNTKWEQDRLSRKWRVVTNGVETLAHEVTVTIPCTTIQEDVPTDGTRWHFLCWGDVFWDDEHRAVIK